MNESTQKRRYQLQMDLLLLYVSDALYILFPVQLECHHRLDIAKRELYLFLKLRAGDQSSRQGFIRTDRLHFVALADLVEGL